MIKFLTNLFKNNNPTPTKIRTTPPPPKTGKYRWVLNSGHGHRQSGYSPSPTKCSPPINAQGERFHEYLFNRIIVTKLIKRMTAEGLYYEDVMGVREENGYPRYINRGSWLKERMELMNDLPNSDLSDKDNSLRLPCIGLSIHANAARTKSVDHWAEDRISGYETWVAPDCTHIHHADTLHRAILHHTHWRDRGIRHVTSKGQTFYELKHAQFPYFLLELGFYNTREGVAQLLDPAFQDKIVAGIMDGVMTIEMVTGVIHKTTTLKNQEI